MELCRIACFIFFFLYFCSYKIASGNSLYHEKQRFFKVFCYCCLYKVAAEQKARSTYENILRLVKDPEVCDPIRFLRAREIVHFQRFGDAKRTDLRSFGAKKRMAFVHALIYNNFKNSSGSNTFILDFL